MFPEVKCLQGGVNVSEEHTRPLKSEGGAGEENSALLRFIDLPSKQINNIVPRKSKRNKNVLVTRPVTTMSPPHLSYAWTEGKNPVTVAGSLDVTLINSVFQVPPCDYLIPSMLSDMFGFGQGMRRDVAWLKVG